MVQQLITFSSHSALVASSRLQAQANQQDVQTSRYRVLLAVNRAYYDVLRAQEVVKVAEKTVEARQEPWTIELRNSLAASCGPSSTFPRPT